VGVPFGGHSLPLGGPRDDGDRGALWVQVGGPREALGAGPTLGGESTPEGWAPTMPRLPYDATPLQKRGWEGRGPAAQPAKSQPAAFFPGHKAPSSPKLEKNLGENQAGWARRHQPIDLFQPPQIFSLVRGWARIQGMGKGVKKEGDCRPPGRGHTGGLGSQVPSSP